MFKVNIKDTSAFIVNSEHILHLVLAFVLLTLNMQLPTAICCIFKVKKVKHTEFIGTILY